MNLRDDLKAYLDGELAPERMAEMREAIDRDPALPKEAEELGRISHTLRAAAAQPASAGLEATLRALEKAERRERKPWWPWLLPVAGMTAFLAFVVSPTMQQAKMAAKSDASVAFRKESQPSATMSAPEMEIAKDVDGGLNGYSSSKVARESAVPENRNPAASSMPNEVKIMRGKGAEGRSSEPFRSGLAKGPQTPKKAVPLPEMKNARAGDFKGQDVPLSSDFSNTKNIAVEPKEKKVGKAEEPTTLEIRVAQAKVPVETMVIEVDSQEEANEAVRALAAQMGVERTLAFAQGVERDSGTATFDAASNRSQVKAERRVVLEVDEDELAETKKRVSETVKESQTRRGQQQNRLRAAPAGAAGFGGGGPSQSQQGETNQGPRQQGLADNPLQRGGQQAGSSQGTQGRTTVPSNQAASPEGKKAMADLQRSKPTSPKPRKRIEIIFRVKPKPAGKLEE